MKRKSDSAEEGRRAHSLDFLSSGGEMGEYMRACDWSQTAVGPAHSWPQSLKTAVRIMLNSRYPMFVWWGQERTNFYNDAYIPILGARHPQALGQPAQQIWADVWPVVGPQADLVLNEGRSTWNESVLLMMERYGYLEETYFTFSYSPVPSDEGGVGGLFCACMEDTDRVIKERQLALLRELAASTAEARTWQQASRLSAEALATNSHDLPFAILYIADNDGWSLAAASGITPGAPGAPLRIDPGTPAVWPLAAINDPQQPGVVDVVDLPLPSGAWQQPPTRVALLPLAATGETGRGGVLVVGINPFRLYQDDYRNFLTLVAGQIAAAIAGAQAFEAERERAEALAQLDRAKTAFFSNVSHEFRTPLTLMLGPVEELLRLDDRALAPQYKAQLTTVHRNSLRLLRLVNTLLDFSRIEAGRLRARFEPHDLATLTADLASVFRAAVERAGLDYDVQCDLLPEAVYVDPEMWEKIVLNLLSNAFKFTHAGAIGVRLQAVDGHSRLTVSDSGIGIPADELPHIFDRFHQVKDMRGRAHEGSGIGLSLVKELVTLHGGEIEVTSLPDVGSRFQVTIPFGNAHLDPTQIAAHSSGERASVEVQAFAQEALRWLPTAAADSEEIWPDADHSHDEPAAADGPRARIILADDNADMREYVSRLLHHRFIVETVADGAAALAAVRANPPDLLLSDIMMPKIDGITLLRTLRADPQLRTIPIVLLSARAGEEARIEGIEAGADDYLIKPFSARELLARVEMQIALTRLRHETERSLRESEHRFRNMADSAPAMLWVTDSDNQCTFLSGGWYEFTGQSEADGLGYGWSNALHPQMRQTALNGVLDAAARRAPFAIDLYVRRADGHYRWAIGRGKPRFDQNGRWLGYIGSVIDVHERKLAEEALRELNETLEERVRDRTAQVRTLVSRLTLAEQEERRRISHILHDDLQQLLYGLKMKLSMFHESLAGAGLAQQAALLSEAQEWIDLAINTTRHLTVDLSPPILQNEGLADALDWLRRQMHELHNLRVTVEAEHRFYLADADRRVLLFQIVRELLFNVKKHAGVDSASVRLEQQDDRIIIHVIDDGSGFDHDPTSASSLTSGFGLFSIRERLGLLGGRLQIDSRPGAGTHITVYAPVNSKGEQPASQPD